MSTMATYIKKLEGYADLEVSIIRTTKINKVLKALIKLNTIPRDEEFQFRKRSVDLLGQWNKILGAEPADGDADKENTTNGVHDEKSEDAETTEEKPIPEPVVEKSEDVGTIEEKPVPELVAPAEIIAVIEVPKPEATVPETVDKAPASAAAATEAAEIVKATA